MTAWVLNGEEIPNDMTTI